jgi:hypothetical protein
MRYDEPGSSLLGEAYVTAARTTIAVVASADHAFVQT